MTKVEHAKIEDESIIDVDDTTTTEAPTKAGLKDDKVAPKKPSCTKRDACPEVRNKILACFGQELQFDRLDIPKQEVAERCGFKKAGSHRFHYTWRVLERDEGLLVKSTEEKGCHRLTDKGKANVPGGDIVLAARVDNAGKQKFFMEGLLKSCKHAKADKVEIMFDILKDGMPHSVDELAKATGYANMKSGGLGYPISHMEKKMKIMEKQGRMWQFTDKCFPDGRP